MLRHHPAVLLLWVSLAHICYGEETTDAPDPQYESDNILIAAASADEEIAPLNTERAIQYLEDGAAAWSQEQRCVTCHTNGTYLLIRPQLSSLAGPTNPAIYEFFAEQLTEFSSLQPEELQEGTTPAQVVYLAAGLAERDRHEGRAASQQTDTALRLMLMLQKPSGTWGSADCWPPLESSSFQVATVAAMALSAVPEWTTLLTETELKDRIRLLKQYLQTQPAPHDYGRVLKLWTSQRWPEILQPDQAHDITELLVSRQHVDGGWSLRDFAEPEQWGGGNRAEKLRAEADFEAPASDGHMTGLALMVLQRESLPANSKESVERGLQWLRTNQRVSGRWWTRSLNTDGPHFITYSATAYALAALHMSQEFTVAPEFGH